MRQECPRCGGSSLHVGDRVCIAGDVNAGLRNFLYGRLQSSGLQRSGTLTRHTDVVVALQTDPALSSSSTVRDMASRGGWIIGQADFERMLTHVCGTEIQPSYLESLPNSINGRVLILGSRDSDLRGPGIDVEAIRLEVRDAQAKASHAGLAQAEHIRPSVALAVVPSGLESDGVVLLCASRGIPLIRARDFLA